MFQKNKYKNTAFILYSINSIIASIILSLSLGFFINKYVQKAIIRTHINYYPHVIQHLVDDHKNIKEFFIENKNGTDADKSLFDQFKVNDSIFRIKIWNTEGKIIWSDDKNNIGKVYSDNKTYQRSLLGFPTYDIETQKKSENIRETVHGDIFELYIPVFSSDKIIGVVEIYEKDQLLAKDLNYSTHIIWIIIAINIFIFYLFRSSLFIYLDRRYKNIFNRLNKTQEATIFAMAYQAELRDSYTGMHIIRTSKYIKIIGNNLKKNKNYKNYITRDYLHDLENAALVHDIGKVAISDSILQKKGKLTPKEFEEMKKHCEYGYQTLLAVKKRLGFRSFLDLAIDIVRYHHEKWDGSGYPKGLKGEEIPLSARMMALADVYDALRTERPYKKAFNHEECLQIIKNESGKHFDPLMVQIFLENHHIFKKESINQKNLL